MKKKAHSVFAALVFFVFLAFIVVGRAEAFCVYNKSNKKVCVKQTSGGKSRLSDYYAYLNPGESGCCNWKNKDCNKSGHRDQWLSFQVDEYDPYFGRQACINLICNIDIRAGGWLVIYDDRCEAGF